MITLGFYGLGLAFVGIIVGIFLMFIFGALAATVENIALKIFFGLVSVIGTITTYVSGFAISVSTIMIAVGIVLWCLDIDISQFQNEHGGNQPVQVDSHQNSDTM